MMRPISTAVAAAAIFVAIITQRLPDLIERAVTLSAGDDRPGLRRLQIGHAMAGGGRAGAEVMADAILTLAGCDKTVPAALMPIPRSNLIGISLYSGAAQPGHHHEVRDGAGLDAADVMEAIGSYGTGQIDIEELHKIECVSLPGSGTCSAMFTANTSEMPAMPLSDRLFELSSNAASALRKIAALQQGSCY